MNAKQLKEKYERLAAREDALIEYHQRLAKNSLGASIVRRELESLEIEIDETLEAWENAE